MKYVLLLMISILMGQSPALAGDTSNAPSTLCAQGQDCSGVDAQRLQAAYDSSQTTPEQREKIIKFIKRNTSNKITNWNDAARDYFSWRQETIAPESYSDFKRRIDGMSFNSLMKVDSSTFDRKKLKYFDEAKARRQNAVNYAYNSTYCSPATGYEAEKCVTPVGIISAKLCSGRDRCYVVISKNFTNACPPSQMMARSVVMAMGSVPPDAEPCNFRYASAGYSGPPILVERTAIDSNVREKTITNSYAYLGSGGQKPITQEKKYYIEVQESYTLAVPIEYYLVNSAAKGDSATGLTIRLSGKYDGSISFSADEIFGFAKKINELNPTFMQ